MNLYIVKTIASTSETKVNTSLQFVMLKPIAEPLAIPTCIVSFIPVICFYFGLFIQVGFEPRYVLRFWFIKFIHFIYLNLKNF